jgi:hypothetical protein
MNNKIIKSLSYILTLNCCLFSCATCTSAKSECEVFEKYYQIESPYDHFMGVINREKTVFNKTEVLGIKKKELSLYVQKINKYIINQQVDLLLENISRTNFEINDYNYFDGARFRGNLSSKIIKELSKHQGEIYYLIFDRLKQTGKVKPTSAKDLDIRTFFICFQDKIQWYYFYNQKQNQYDVWFSMPMGFLYSFSFFHYVIKEENDKFILVGF